MAFRSLLAACLCLTLWCTCCVSPNLLAAARETPTLQQQSTPAGGRAPASSAGMAVLIDKAERLIHSLKDACSPPAPGDTSTARKEFNVSLSFFVTCSSRELRDCTALEAGVDDMWQIVFGHFGCGDGGEWKYHTVQLAAPTVWCSNVSSSRKLSIRLLNSTSECAKDSRQIPWSSPQEKSDPYPFNATIRSENGTTEISSLGRNITLTTLASSTNTTLQISLTELVDMRCEYMVLLAPSLLHAQFMTLSQRNTTHTWDLEVSFCFTGELTALVLSMGCSPPKTVTLEARWPSLLSSTVFSSACERRSPSSFCSGNEPGFWLLEPHYASHAARYQVHSYNSASEGHLPIIAHYWNPNGPDWTQLVYGQWLAWGLWTDRYDQAMYGVRHSMAGLNLTSPINNTADMFTWQPHSCRFLRLPHAVALLRQLQAGRRATAIGEESAENNEDDREEKQTPSAEKEEQEEQEEEECWISRIGTAGTSRMRGLFYGLQSALRGGKVTREKLRRAAYIGHDLGGVRLDYVPLHGSEYAQFFWQNGVQGVRPGKLRCEAAARAMEVWLLERGYCLPGAVAQRGERQLLCVTLGLYEVLWGPTEELEACGRHFLHRIQRRCGGTSTVVVYKTEEACPSKFADQPEHWQLKTLAANRIMAGIAAELGLPILDAHAMTLARSDATQDGSHYWYFNTQDPEELAELEAGKDLPAHVRPDPDTVERFSENAVSKALASALLQLGMDLACPSSVRRLLNSTLDAPSGDDRRRRRRRHNQQGDAATASSKTRPEDAGGGCADAVDVEAPSCLRALSHGTFYRVPTLAVASTLNRGSDPTAKLDASAPRIFRPDPQGQDDCACAVEYWRDWRTEGACQCLHGVHMAFIGGEHVQRTAAHVASVLGMQLRVGAEEEQGKAEDVVEGDAGGEAQASKRWVGCEGGTSVVFQPTHGERGTRDAVRRAEAEVKRGAVHRVVVVIEADEGSREKDSVEEIARAWRDETGGAGLWRQSALIWKPGSGNTAVEEKLRHSNASRMTELGVGTLELRGLGSEETAREDAESMARAEAQVLVNYACLRGAVLASRIRRHRRSRTGAKAARGQTHEDAGARGGGDEGGGTGTGTGARSLATPIPTASGPGPTHRYSERGEEPEESHDKCTAESGNQDTSGGQRKSTATTAASPPPSSDRQLP